MPQTFDWDYAAEDVSLSALYSMSKDEQWDAARDIDWNLGEGTFPRGLLNVKPNDDTEQAAAFAAELQKWVISQILHGEQGAMLAAANIVEKAPSLEIKAASAVQVVDEMRHIEVFRQFLDTRHGGRYPPEVALESLLIQIIENPDWDMIALGTHILIEGLALASFGMLKRASLDPLLRQILRRVMRDESRHISIGFSALTPVYSELSASELKFRQEFIIEALILLYSKAKHEQIYERLEMTPSQQQVVGRLSGEQTTQLRRDLSRKIVPYCRRLGLLEANQSFLAKEIARLDLADL